MTLPFLPSWEDVDREYLRVGMPGEFVLREMPRATVSVGADCAYLSASFEIDSAEVLVKNILSGIDLRVVTQAGRLFYRLSVTNSNLFRPFFHFVIDLVYSVHDAQNASVANAINAALTTWARLFARQSVLSPEREMGLYGELLALLLFFEVLGPEAVQSWTGPQGAPHDFRFCTTEFEVKTTSRDRRLHTINGLDQLRASNDFDLFFISIRITTAGSGGDTLGDVIRQIRDLLSSDPSALNDFEAKLAIAGYNDHEASLYSDRFKLADDARVVVVDDDFPRLTADTIASINVSFDPRRLFITSYSIDATGLGDSLDVSILQRLLES